MHISFILPDIRGGGAQKMIINLANFYSAQGHKVDLILIQNEGCYKKLISQKVNIITFNKKRSLLGVNKLRSYFKKNGTIDAVISCMYYINIITIIANILGGNKQKIIVTERNHFTRRITSESFLHQFVFKNLVRFFYPQASHIVGISNGVRDDLKSFLKNNKNAPVCRIYNPVISADFQDKVNKDIENIFPPDCALKLVASGRLVEQKDYPTMIGALSYYKKHYNGSFHLVILGDGVMKNRLLDAIKEAGLQENITLKGFVENPLSYMKQADIFLISSAWEGFGNVIVEALYCGLKIVSTDCPSGPAEILENGEYGELIPVGDSVTFAKALHKASISSISSQKQKKRSLDFTVDKIASEFEAIIND